MDSRQCPAREEDTDAQTSAGHNRGGRRCVARPRNGGGAAGPDGPSGRLFPGVLRLHAADQPACQRATGVTPAGALTGTLNQATAAGVGDVGDRRLCRGADTTAPPRRAAQSARTGKHDFSTDAEIHVFVNGKTANGLTYGAVVEIQFDTSEGTGRTARRSYTSKTGADIDEAYAFIASPTLGQVRFGDEDGPFGGLMNAGIITNFGSGGVYGDWQDFVIRPNRTTTSPGDVGDNSKIIYLSPQFFGFDFGASWAFNEGEGADTGCMPALAGTSLRPRLRGTGRDRLRPRQPAACRAAATSTRAWRAGAAMSARSASRFPAA